MSLAACIDVPVIGSGCLCCDIDNDAWLNIVQFTYSRPHDAIYTLALYPGGLLTATVYRIEWLEIRWPSGHLQ